MLTDSGCQEKSVFGRMLTSAPTYNKKQGKQTAENTERGVFVTIYPKSVPATVSTSQYPECQLT
jgi:hypothetical protein